MKNLVQSLNAAHTLVKDIRSHSEGLDPNLLLEVLMLTDADFSEPMDGKTLLATMRKEGLLP